MEQLTAATARKRLEQMLQWQATPALSVDEVDELFEMAKRYDAYGVVWDAYPDWKPSVAVGLLAERVPPTRNGSFYRVTTAGTTGATQPVWPTSIGATVSDGSVVWTCAGRAAWTPTFDLRYAAAEGWEMKAAKVVGSYDVKAGSVDAKRNQVYLACMRKARQLRGGGIGSIQGRATPQVYV